MNEIIAKEFPSEVFESKEALFSKLKENKQLLISQKKLNNKYADSFDYNSILINKKIDADKEDTFVEDPRLLKVRSVINTTNILDSHGDVHLKGIWNKSVRENKNLLLLNQHKQRFEDIITSDIKASVKKYSWRELGYEADGETEALIFDSNIHEERNPFMFDQYKRGYVRNHSVGMRYVKIELALNSDSKWNEEEKAVWDKHIDEIINKQDAERLGYFWAVYEAKVIEGSAVVFGSNPITPTLSVQEKNEPTQVTQDNKNEPSNDTQKMIEIIKNLK